MQLALDECSRPVKLHCFDWASMLCCEGITSTWEKGLPVISHKIKAKLFLTNSLKTWNYNCNILFCKMSCLLHPSPKLNRVFPVGENISNMDNVALTFSRVHMCKQLYTVIFLVRMGWMFVHRIPPVYEQKYLFDNSNHEYVNICNNLVSAKKKFFWMGLYFTSSPWVVLSVPCNSGFAGQWRKSLITMPAKAVFIIVC